MKIAEYVRKSLTRFFGKCRRNKNNNRIEEKTPKAIEQKPGELQEAQKKIKAELQTEKEIRKQTLLSSLYLIEQEITICKTNHPKEYKEFLDRITFLRERYIFSSSQISKGSITFEVDPDKDMKMIGKVGILKKDVERYIKRDMVFENLSTRLQRLIVKLNILYNTSLKYNSEDERGKVISQLKYALESNLNIAQELKRCEKVREDAKLAERIINLIAYADYQILKTHIRNSSEEEPKNLIEKLVVVGEFIEYDYVSIFKAYIMNEISDLMEESADDECYKLPKEKLTKLIAYITYADDVKMLKDTDFWNYFLDCEILIVKMMQSRSVEKGIKIIDMINVKVDIKTLFTTPKESTLLSLRKLHYKSQDSRIMLLLRIVENISEETTYKELFLLFLLFKVDVLYLDEFYMYKEYLNYYNKKYLNYNDMEYTLKKKSKGIYASNKEYVVVFYINESDDKKEITTALEELNLDFKIIGNKVLMNAYYFRGLDNVGFTKL